MNLRFVTIVLAATWPTLTCAQSLGAGPGGSDSGNELLFEEAGRMPDDTSSVTFTGPGVGSDPNEWTWRVNITSVALPDGDNVSVVNTQYDLQWPRGGDLLSYLQQEREDCVGICTESPLCYQQMVISLPSNVTARYSESDNGNCTNVLGDDCAQAAIEALSLSSSCGAQRLQSIRGCEDSLDLGSLATFSFFLGNSTNVTAVSPDGEGGSRPLQSGDAVGYWASAPQSAGNTSNYEYAERLLYMLALTGGPVEDGRGTSALLCQVVNTTAASTSGAVASVATQAVLYLLSAAVVLQVVM